MKLLLNLSVDAGIEWAQTELMKRKLSGEGDLRIRFSGSLFSILQIMLRNLLLTPCLITGDMFSEIVIKGYNYVVQVT